MRIAVSSTGDSPDSPVDIGFGRASGFVIYDEGTGQYAFIDNSDTLQRSAGIGLSTVSSLAKADVQTVLTGRLGPKAADALNKAGIQVHSLLGKTSVAEAVKAFQAGKLPRLSPERTLPEAQSTACPGRPAGRGAGQGRGLGRGGGGKGR